MIVTNNHVVSGAQELQVVLGDKREYSAKVLVADPRSDLAVLKIDTKGEKLTPLKFADTSAALVGDQVLAIGNPFGAVSYTHLDVYKRQKRSTWNRVVTKLN